MTTISISNILAGTLSPDQATRSASENHLQQFATLPKFSIDMLKFLTSSNDGNEFKQAGAVYLKNFIDKKWAELPEDEKVVFRESLVPAMLAVKDCIPVQKQLRECVHKIVREDFPEKWDSLADQIYSCLSDERSVLTGLIVLFEVVSWKGYDNDTYTEEMHARFGPMLLRLGEMSLKVGGNTGYLLVRWILKIFKSAIQFKFSYPFLSNFAAWNRLFCEVIQLSTKNESDDEESEWWKMKKWAFICQNRVFFRFGGEKIHSTTTEAVGFQKEYLQSYAPQIMGIVLKIVEGVISNKIIIVESVYIEICEYLEHSIKCNELWKKHSLKSHINHIIQLFLFPKICFSEEDMEEWQDDPVEYIRTRLDPYEEYETASVVALNLICDCVRARTKTAFPDLLVFVNGVLQDAAHPPRQDGALKILGSLVPQIKKREHLKSQINALISSLIFPLLAESSVSFLRMRAAWALEQFSQQVNLDNNLSIEAFKILYTNLIDTKTDLPVRVQSALTIGSLLDVDVVQEAVSGQTVLKLTEAILNLTSTAEIEALSSLIEKLVTMYSEELSPYSSQLAQQLANTFVRMANTIEVSGESDNNLEFDTTEKMMSAIGLMKAISALVESMSSNKNLLLSLCEIIAPLAVLIFSKGLVDVFDEMFEILCGLTFNLKMIPANLWKVYECMFAVYMRNGIEHISDICSVLDNFISYGSKTIMENSEYRNKLISLVNIVLSNKENNFCDEFNSVCMVLESLFLNNQAPLEQDILVVFIGLLENRLKIESEDHSKVSIIRILQVYLAIIISYNTSILHLLPPLFWEELIKENNSFTRVHDKKLIIVAFSSIINIIEQPQVVSVYLNAVMTLPDALKKRQKLLEEGNSDESDSDDYDYTNASDYDSLDSEPENNDSATKETTSADDSSSYEWSDSDYSGYDSEELLDEDLTSETPLDSLDVTPLIKMGVMNLKAGVVGSLDEKKQQFIKSFY